VLGSSESVPFTQHSIFVGKSKGTRPVILGIYDEDNIKMDFNGMWCGNVN
jgi:hypothetical protein